MLHKSDVIKDAIRIANLRPSADLTIEQYLMTYESLAVQVMSLQSSFRDKTILHLGDDDHLSVLFAHYLGSSPIVAEYDTRIRSSLRDTYGQYGIANYKLFRYDARRLMPSSVKADAFYINPPYSSKNNGRGVKLWLGRVAPAVPVGSTSVLVYPINETLPWTLVCIQEIIRYAYECGLVVTNIDRDLHTYQYLPKDPGLLSSNIYLYKFADADPSRIVIGDLHGESIYR